MSDKLVEHQPATLTKARRGPSDWLSYVWTVDQVPELKLFIESQTGVEIVPGDMDFCIQQQNGKEVLKPYPRAEYLNKVAHHRKISRKVELVDKVLTATFKMAIVKVTALYEDSYHEELGTCDSSEPGRSHAPFSSILGMAITRATNRAYRKFLGLPTSAEEMPPELIQMKKDLAEETLQNCPQCKQKGYSRLQKACYECGFIVEAAE
jgi:hypothetical protein